MWGAIVRMIVSEVVGRVLAIALSALNKIKKKKHDCKCPESSD